MPELSDNKIDSNRNTEAEIAAARRMVADQPDSEMLLQMLGLEPYESYTPPRNTTPIKHGVRSGYTNRGCGKTGSPPCPASPTCAEANYAYYRAYRESHAA